MNMRMPRRRQSQYDARPRGIFCAVSGSAIVEIALLFPVLAALMGGFFVLAMLIFQKAALMHATAAAVRCVVVNRGIALPFLYVQSRCAPAAGRMATVSRSGMRLNALVFQGVRFGPRARMLPGAFRDRMDVVSPLDVKFLDRAFPGGARD